MKEIKFDRKLLENERYRVNYHVNEITVVKEYTDEFGENQIEYNREVIHPCKYVEFNSEVSDEKVIQVIKAMYDYSDWID